MLLGFLLIGVMGVCFLAALAVGRFKVLGEVLEGVMALAALVVWSSATALVVYLIAKAVM